MSVINVVVTCTNGKRATIPPALRLRSVKGATVGERAERWAKQLKSSKVPTIPAADLYAGQHWRTARAIANDTKGNNQAIVWVCSAGYGLIPFEARIRPYSATFSEDNPDCVSRGRHGLTVSAARRAWWGALARWKPFKAPAPRTLAALAEKASSSPLLIITSPKYLDAMAEDLTGALAALKWADNLVIVCAGAKKTGPLSEHIVPCDERLQSVVGGAKWALNVRVGKKILDERTRWPVRSSVLHERYASLLRRLDPPDKVCRTPLTDQKVMAFIRKALREDPDTSHSPELRKLRDAGFACEQDRFRSLFKKVTREARGRR